MIGPSTLPEMSEQFETFYERNTIKRNNPDLTAIKAIPDISQIVCSMTIEANFLGARFTVTLNSLQPRRVIKATKDDFDYSAEILKFLDETAINLIKMNKKMSMVLTYTMNVIVYKGIYDDTTKFEFKGKQTIFDFIITHDGIISA